MCCGACVDRIGRRRRPGSGRGWGMGGSVSEEVLVIVRIALGRIVL
jgi:hypothetical protein